MDLLYRKVSSTHGDAGRNPLLFTPCGSTPRHLAGTASAGACARESFFPAPRLISPSHRNHFAFPPCLLLVALSHLQIVSSKSSKFYLLLFSQTLFVPVKLLYFFVRLFCCAVLPTSTDHHLFEFGFLSEYYCAAQKPKILSQWLTMFPFFDSKIVASLGLAVGSATDE